MHIALWTLLVATAIAPAAPAQVPPAAPNGAKGKIFVGILDDAREEMVNWQPGVSSQRFVRPAFEKTRSGWRKIVPAPLPARMTWTVAFDGRDLGQIKSEAGWNGYGPGHNGMPPLTLVQTIVTPAAAVPSIGAPSEEFSFLGMGPTKVRRPLVVVSAPNFSDPDGWKRVTPLPESIATLVRLAFRQDFPHVSRCKDEVIVQRNWSFPDSALKLPIAYASNKNSFLVVADLDAGDCGYVDDPDDPLSNPWFFVSANGTVRRLGGFLTLIDAGDYGNDGKSELIFLLEQPENTEGFILYDADLHKQASLIWHYH